MTRFGIARLLVKTHYLLACVLLFYVPNSSATVFGVVRGIVRDPQLHSINQARVTLQANDSGYRLLADTSPDGEFQFDAVPLGQYTIGVEAPGFTAQSQFLQLTSGSAPALHYQLALATAKQEVTVTASPEDLNPDSPRRTILIDSQQISRYAGVDASNSFKIITEFVPGSYMVHDQLHVRGGHQVTWAIDGVPIPNTNIASNVGPQFNPKDVSYLQAETGSYAAEYGDRIYGVFNVAPKNGFERDKQAELIASYGSYNGTDDWLSFGNHTEKFAYYASISGNSTEWGLEPPTTENLHNQAMGGGGFTSLLYNPTTRDQLRFDAGVHLDYFEVPNDPEMQVAGVNDRQREQDIAVVGTWVRTINPNLLFVLSPFYHFNRGVYDGGIGSASFAADNRGSNYEG